MELHALHFPRPSEKTFDNMTFVLGWTALLEGLVVCCLAWDGGPIT